jgi:Cytochrome c554 and c-prime
MVRKAALIVLANMVLASAHGDPALPSNGPDRHMGVGSCSSSVCHGAITPRGADVLLNEYVTWSHQDSHAKAYAALLSPKGQSIAAKLGLRDASTSKECLDCHADNVAPSLRGEKFSLADGIGCEACHGGAEHWLATHSSKQATYRANVSRGMYPTADLRPRTTLCLSCHFGNADKFATHRMMAAGHPRLSFELDTFLAIQPPHYRIDEDYRRRKPTYDSTQVWAFGQLAAAAEQLRLLQGPLISTGNTFPELALFNCYGCHMSSMRKTDWRRRLFEIRSAPGSVPLDSGHLIMAWIITRQLQPQSAPELLQMSQSLLAATTTQPSQIVASSVLLRRTLDQLRDAAAGHVWSVAERRNLLSALLATGVSGEFRDYMGAEQAVMGIDGLLLELRQAEPHRGRIKELYRLTQNDEAFKPEEFETALRQLQAELEPGTTTN